METITLQTLFRRHKEEALFGRYIYSEHIKPLLKKHNANFRIKVIGQSVLGKDIHSITIGKGSKKIFMWSQMHGNESTTTKAIFDLLNLLSATEAFSLSVLKHCTIIIIPILNPDGAKAYTRLNANAVDLNRDAQELSQPESKILRDCFNSFKPHFCFNLHGQRSIFSTGNTAHVATVSFLSPAQDKMCSVTNNRRVAMSLINDMNVMLQKEIPNQIGIYDDAYNVNCVGDMFQTLLVPTVLFEAGHYKNDYNREMTRRYIFQSLITAINSVVGDEIDSNSDEAYSKIPQNEKYFYDIIIKNARLKNKTVDVAIQYEERLRDGYIHFIPKVVKIEKLDNFYGHKLIEANNNQVLTLKGEAVILGSEIDLVKIQNAVFSLKIE